MGRALSDMEGKEFYGEYMPDTDPLVNDKEYPVSHAGYGYAAVVVTLGEDKKIEKYVAAYDVGQVINPKACEGQIEGGIVMGMGYALTEDFKLENSVVKSKYGTLGLLKANQIPPMEVKFVKAEDLHEGLAYGVKGVGELATIPTAPAIAGAYYALDGKLRNKLPIEDSPYVRK